jgi:hypothetical protein
MNLCKRQPNSIFLITTLLLVSGTFSLFGQKNTHLSSRSSPSNITPTAFQDPALVRRYQQTITPETLASRLYFIASDFFEGRETSARGQKLAADYLASQYRQMGISPRGTAKTDDPLSLNAYFQPFNVYKRLPKEARLEVAVGGKVLAKSLFSTETHDDLAYFSVSNPVDASGGVVFAGYGIADDQLAYNDYAALKSKGISTDGKWVMILADEPLSDASTSRLQTADHKPSKWTLQAPHKRRALYQSGQAKGLLIVSDASARAVGTFAENAAHASLDARRIGAIALQKTLPPDTVPTYYISTKMANQILASSGHSIEDLTQEINKTLKPVVFDVKDSVVSSSVEQFDPLETENVLAFIEGSDAKLKDEVIVISAHYDHLGSNPFLKGDQIFNGAADDGSGTVAVLSLAEAFMKAKREGAGPRRSILFINFSGEEKGTIGSSYYANTAPVVPLEQTVADINMDGIGGFDPNHPTKSKNYIYIVGEKPLSDELQDINKRLNALTGIKLDLTDASFPSDQTSFASNMVPYLYYSTGYIEHYHQPGDEAKTIDYAHMARVTQLIFATVWQVANQDARLKSVDRSRLEIEGYVCPPCPFECDAFVHKHAGVCPVCGMNLVPKFKLKA